MDQGLIPLDYDPFATASEPEPSGGGKLIPLDYDPFGEDGSILKEVPKGIAAGATEATGAAIRGSAAQRQQIQYERATAEARRKALGGAEGPGLGGYEVKPITPEVREEITTATNLIPVPDVTKDPWFQTGQALTEWSQEQFKAARDYQDSYTRMVTTGLGSTIPYVALAPLGAGAIAPGMAFSAGEAVDRAIAGGASKEEIMQAVKLGGLPGLTEQIPIDIALERIPLPVVGKWLGVFGKVLGKAMAEGGQEAVTQVAQNVIEKYVYDPDQDVTEGVLQAAGIGAAVGGIIAVPTTRPTKALVATEEDVGQPTPGGTGTTPAPPPGTTQATEPAPLPGQPSPPSTSEAKPAVPGASAPAGASVAPVAPVAPGPVVPDGTLPADQQAAIGGAPVSPAPAIPEQVDEDEDASDVFPEAWETEEEQAERLAVKPRPVTPVVGVAPEVASPAAPATPSAPAATAPVVAGMDPAIAAVLADIDAAVGRIAPQGAAPSPAAVPPAPAVPSAPAAQVPTPPPAVAPPTPLVAAPPVAAEPPLAPEPPTDVSLEPAAPPAALQPPVEPVLAAPAYREIREVEGDPFAVPAVIPGLTAAPAADPAPVPALPVDEKAGQMARQFEDTLWQEVRARRDPELAQWEHLPQVVRAVATKMARGATKTRGLSPRQMIEQAAPRMSAGVDEVFRMHREATAQRAIEEIEAAEAKSKATAAEARATGAPAERARAGKQKGKTAEEVKGQSRYSWMRLVKKEMEKPEAERAPEIVEYAAAKEERKKVQGRKAKRDEQTARMEAAEKAYVERLKQAEVDKKTAILPPKAPPSSEVATTTEQAVAVREPSPQEKKNAKVAEKLAPVISAFPMPTERSIILNKDNGKSAIADFNAQVQAALGDSKLGETPLFGTGFDSNGKPRPAHSLEENVAIYAKSLAKRRQSSPFDNITDFMKMLAFYKGGTEADAQNLKGMMVSEAIDARQVQDDTMTSIADEIGYFEEQDARKAVRHSAIRIKKRSSGSLSGSNEDAIPIHVVNPDTGERMRMDSTASMTGAEALKGVSGIWRDLFRGHQEQRDLERLVMGRDNTSFQFYSGGLGLNNVLFRLTNKQLRTLVGDIQVDFVSGADMEQLSGRQESYGGVYLNYTAEERAAGAKPRILINKEFYDNASPAIQHYIIMHEMTHAATSYALEHNIRGTRQIVAEMRKALEKQILATYGHMPEQYEYGFKNDAEFVAEAFSNSTFQELLATAPIPAGANAAISTIAATHGHKLSTWWDAFVQMVSRALAPWHRKGQTSYLERIISLAPQMTMTTAEQQADAEAGRTNDDGGMETALHPLQINKITNDILAMGKLRAKVGVSKFNRGKVMFQTTENMKRNSEEIFDDGAELFNEVASLLQSSTPRRLKYLETVDNETSRLIQEKHKDAKAFSEASEMAFTATKLGYDPSVPLSHADNKHILKGVRDAQARAGHARDHAKWMALPASLRSAFAAASNNLKGMENQRIEKTVRNIIDAVVNPTTGTGVALPPNTSVDDVVQWVMDGRIDRQPGDPNNPKSTDQTPADAALHKALGKTISSLTGTKEMRRIKGMYVPLVRQGRYFFTAREPVAIPAGAKLVRKDKAGVHIVFDNPVRKDNDKAARDFLESTDHVVSSKVSEWIDPLTGKKTQQSAVYADPNNPTGPLIQPVQRWRMVVQDKYMEMSDDEAALIKLQEDYRKSGFEITSDVAVVDNILHANSELHPEHINRMLRSVEQTSPGTTSSAQQNIQGAIVSAYTRQLGGTRAQHRRLKRKSVGGHSADFVRAMHSAGSAMAGHLAQLDYGPAMARAEDKLHRFINDSSSRQQGKGKTALRQAYYSEIKRRATAAMKRNDATWGERSINAAMASSFIYNLVSPAYSIFNLIGGQINTFAHLVGKFGLGKAMRLHTRALMMLSPHKVLWGGAVDTAKSIKGFWPGSMPFKGRDYESDVRRMTAGVAGFDKVIDEMNDIGLGIGAGIEAPEVGELEKNRAEVALNRVAILGRQMPQAVETTNRFVAALANYMGAIEQGMAQEKAQRLAVTQVEKTQGGYAAENNPNFMGGKWSRIAMQFKKYPLMYAQAYFGSMVRMVAPGKGSRMEAARTFAWMTGLTIALAGTHGLPFMEIAKVFFLLMTAFQGDWEEKENWIQEMQAKGFEWLGGSKSNAQFYSEMLSYGLPRLVGMETSRRLGTAEVFTHGSPKFKDGQPEWAPWILDQLIGAPGGMAQNLYEGWTSEFDIKKAIPMPKLMKDILKAHELATEGTKDKTTGKQYQGPITGYEAGLQAFGIQPASQARPFEAFGKATKRKADQKLKRERSTIISQFTNAPPHQQQKIFREVIMPWNRKHPTKEISWSSLKRSASSTSAADRREAEEELLERLGR